MSEQAEVARKTDDGGAKRLWPKGEAVQIGDREVQIVPVALGDLEGWQQLIGDVLGDLSGKAEVSEQEFITLLLNPKRVRHAMEFIVCRPRVDEDGRSVRVNPMTEHEIRNISLPEAVAVIEALCRVTDVMGLLGKVRGAWAAVEAMFGAAKQEAKPAPKPVASRAA